MSSLVHKKLEKVSRRLPAGLVQEALDFAEFLLLKSTPRTANGAARGRKALNKYIGGVRHGGLASGIDDELYGRPIR